MNRSSKSFTLIELLVVVAIIATLIAILLPALASARNTAKRVLCASNFHSVGQGLIAYSNDYNSYAPYACYSYGATRTYYWPGAHGSTGYMGLGLLWREHYISDGNIFQCPMLPGFYDNIDTFEGYLTSFPEDGKCVTRIMYLPAIRRVMISPEPTEKERHKLLPSTAFLTESISWWLIGAHGEGNNVLYGDGSVAFLQTVGAGTNNARWVDYHAHELDKWWH